MIKTYETSTWSGFSMPISWTAVRPAAVRTFPTQGGVSVNAAEASLRRTADVAQVCALPGTADVFVLEGAFPGTSAWSPPI